jgi:hypothetical protein
LDFLLQTVPQDRSRDPVSRDYSPAIGLGPQVLVIPLAVAAATVVALARQKQSLEVRDRELATRLGVLESEAALDSIVSAVRYASSLLPWTPRPDPAPL